MTLALPCLMAYELIGQQTHEILGLCTVGLFILHHAMNWQWHKNLFSGKYTVYRTVLTVLDILIIIVRHRFHRLSHLVGRDPEHRLHLYGGI